jgi:hypothetical protein
MTVIYGAAVLVLQLPLIVGLFLLSFWLLNVAGPLLRGDVAFGHPAYEYLQSSKDLLVVAFGVLTATLALSSVLLHRWWKRSTAALGPMPAELRPKTFKAWNRQRRIIKGTYLAGGAAVLWILVLTVTEVASGVQAYEAWAAPGKIGFDDPGYDEAHALLDTSIALGGVGAIAFSIFSVSCWRSYGRAQHVLGPEPARVTIRELDQLNVNQRD